MQINTFWLQFGGLSLAVTLKIRSKKMFVRIAIKADFHFPQYKSVETLSCHSNNCQFSSPLPPPSGSIRVAEPLALPTSDHRVAGSNPAGGEILPEPKRRFIAQSLSCSPSHHLEMTEILLKGCKTLTHPSIHPSFSPIKSQWQLTVAIATRVLI